MRAVHPPFPAAPFLPTGVDALCIQTVTAKEGANTHLGDYKTCTGDGALKFQSLLQEMFNRLLQVGSITTADCSSSLYRMAGGASPKPCMRRGCLQVLLYPEQVF